MSLEQDVARMVKLNPHIPEKDLRALVSISYLKADIVKRMNPQTKEDWVRVDLELAAQVHL